MDKAVIDNNFTYHAPHGTQGDTYDSIRGKAREYAHWLNETLPEGREKALALTNLEQAVFWANAAVARY